MGKTDSMGHVVKLQFAFDQEGKEIRFSPVEAHRGSQEGLHLSQVKQLQRFSQTDFEQPSSLRCTST